MKYSKLAYLALSLLVACAGGGSACANSDALVYQAGDTEIFAVCDAVSERNRDFLRGDEKLIKKLMPTETSSDGTVNVFAIKTKTDLILIDAGWGLPRGNALKHLEKFGIKPDKVTAVLFTHLHGDHVSGLLNEGKAVFPNAAIYLSQAERDYWFSDEEMNKHTNKAGFNLARQEILAYADRINTFEPGETILPQITAVNLYGHTPGHVGFLLTAGTKHILFWGDITHFTEVQMTAPEITVTYDINAPQAASTRLNILPWVARENIFIGGSHLPTGLGKITAAGDGSYLFKIVENLD
ncbi:MAG: MBL fold metallo-hydrolase [Sporomusaceae bacterium]|jgi:glyoxylase-like metal-dependent hydrolase (beta-lactamase superfamily II)|nr:MBL fold metallo-hydrolase [Sporomusaceae bacterium]